MYNNYEKSFGGHLKCTNATLGSTRIYKTRQGLHWSTFHPTLRIKKMFLEWNFISGWPLVTLPYCRPTVFVPLIGRLLSWIGRMCPAVTNVILHAHSIGLSISAGGTGRAPGRYCLPLMTIVAAPGRNNFGSMVDAIATGVIVLYHL